MGGASGAVTAFAVGVPALRLRGLYLAVTTFAFGLAVQSWVLNDRFFGWFPRTDQRFEELRASLVESLDKIRGENEAKLEQMRLTVDEKLQGTLEARLGDSFRLVSERLELVHKGIGEMQNLATGVGDLKRVLTNVKSRGGWGEVQLGMLLEDLLTVDQYAKNVRIRPDAGETVEFAVRLPGKGDTTTPLYLPIDAKFPHEDYDRLLTAQESGFPDEVEKAAQALERAVRA